MRFARIAALVALIILAGALAACSPEGIHHDQEPALQVEQTDHPAYLRTPPRQTPEPAQVPVATQTTAEHVVFGDVTIDGVDLKGLTKENAKKQVVANQKERLKAVSVTLQYGEKNWKFTYKDVICSFNTDEVIQNAWDTDEKNALQPQNGAELVNLETTLSIDPSTIEQKVRNLAFSFYVPFENSTFAGYDPTKPDGSRLSFTKAKPGKQVDADALWAAVEKEFADGTFGTVQIKLEDVPAKITDADWQKNMKLVSRFYSVQNSSPPRYTNIKIACAAINGHFIMPGETFSFNDTTGQRTAQKGYQMAHVINGGVIDNGLAGGTCQVSGTLFNAAARADLSIEERHSHTLRSAYLPMGQDATVDYGHYDLKLKNDSDSPVLIIMYLGTGKNKNNVYAEIYGKPLPSGETIDLMSRITETVPAPNTVSFATSDSVKPGTYETVKPHAGYKVSTYKVYKRNGKAVRTVLLHKDYYKEAGSIIVYNPADPQPTIPPSLATPTPGASPTPTPKPH